jgi:hypothetical protein
LTPLAFGLMSLAPLVTAGRAAMAEFSITEPGFYWVFFAIGGTTSGLGMLALLFAHWRGSVFAWVLAGVVIALFGHNVAPHVGLSMFGASLVHLGTGLAVRRWQTLGFVGGIVAAIGAYIRVGTPLLGNLILLIGAGALCAGIVQAARESWPTGIE